MAQMKTDHPGFKLLVSLPGTLHTERLLHDAFALDRDQGEWFRPSAALREFVRIRSAKETAIE